MTGNTRLLTAVPLLLLAACAHQPVAEPAQPLRLSPAAESPPAPGTPDTPSTSSTWTPISGFTGHPLVGNASAFEYTVRHQDRTFSLQVIAFDSRELDLRVIDQPDDWAGGGHIAESLRAAGAVAGVNGGFFTPAFAPLGLMVADGRRTGVWQSNPLLTGAIVVTTHPQLLWNDEVQPDAAHQLLQAGPRLVDAARPVPGLDRKKASTRTFIATDGGDQWVLGRVENATLAELAELLSIPGLMPAFKVHRALNLDGGRSSAIYYRTNDGREHSDPGWSTVRNYLGIVPR